MDHGQVDLPQAFEMHLIPVGEADHELATPLPNVAAEVLAHGHDVVWAGVQGRAGGQLRDLVE